MGATGASRGGGGARGGRGGRAVLQGGRQRTPGNITVQTAAGPITGSGPVVRRTANTRAGRITGGVAVTPTARTAAGVVSGGRRRRRNG